MGYECVVLPMGGAKGSGLSLMMEIVAGVMSGSDFGGGVRNQYFNFDEPQDVGHCFIALRPHLFMPLETYRERMSELQRSEEHPSELQSLMRISYAVFCWKKKTIDSRPSDNFLFYTRY